MILFTRYASLSSDIKNSLRFSSLLISKAPSGRFADAIIPFAGLPFTTSAATPALPTTNISAAIAAAFFITLDFLPFFKPKPSFQ